MPGKGLGRGLDSLIPPDFYDEDFDSNSTQSLEDMLNNMNEKEVEEVETPEDENKNIFEEIEEENDKEDDSASGEVEDVPEEIPEELPEEENEEDDKASEEVSGDTGIEEDVQSSQKIQVDPSHVDEVTQIVDKNPRITLWSSRSAAVLRYLRKTEPEFSISKEASTLIDEPVSKKYPEIWELFDQY